MLTYTEATNRLHNWREKLNKTAKDRKKEFDFWNLAHTQLKANLTLDLRYPAGGIMGEEHGVQAKADYYREFIENVPDKLVKSKCTK